ncbi:MAG: hypothetical protein IPM25_03440 [Chloracidobacterium sp.]|nr:hypothetical protein [Chloracidobacterium sp.]
MRREDRYPGRLQGSKPVNKNLVDAQQTRRILDRLVVYKVSPLLWTAIGGRLSAGRVQTVAVRLGNSEANARSRRSSRPNIGRSSRTYLPRCRRTLIRSFIRSKIKPSKAANLMRI